MLRILVLAALLAGCRPSSSEPAGNSEKTSEVAARIDKLQEDEGEVLSRRDALTREREKVAVDRQALEAKKRTLREKGADSTEVDDEEKALEAREAKLRAEETDLQRRLEALLTRYRAEAQSPGPAADATRREASVASREKDMARREGTLAEREARLADREKELARRERETCAVTPTTIVQTVPERGARYGRRDVEPLLASARRKMSEKGLLASDLPAPAKGLEREAASAMSSGDWSKAKFAADQLVVTIDSVRVDKAFIAGKISRLNAAVRSAKLGSDAQKQVDDLFREATADYGDGKFASANGKLNRIYGVVQ